MEWLGYPITPITGGFVFNQNSPYSTIFNEHEWVLLKNVSQIEFEVLRDYILNQISPFETLTRFSRKFTSYGLKHRAEKNVKFYVPEVLFRVVMRICNMDEKIISSWKIDRVNRQLPTPTTSIYKLSVDLFDCPVPYKMPYDLLVELKKLPSYCPDAYSWR